MRSCIAVFYIALFCASGRRARAGRRPTRSTASAPIAGKRARGRGDLGARSSPPNPRDFESAWKLARAMYWLGSHGPAGGAARRRSSAASPRAARRRRSQPDAARGTLLDRRQHGRARRVVRPAAGAASTAAPIKDALETVLRIDPAFQQGSADRALGRWYYKVPGLFGGSKKKSEEHLRKSLTYDPEQHRLALLPRRDAVRARSRRRGDRRSCEKVIAAPLDPEWEPEDREFKEQAKRRARVGQDSGCETSPIPRSARASAPQLPPALGRPAAFVHRLLHAERGAAVARLAAGAAGPQGTGARHGRPRAGRPDRRLLDDRRRRRRRAEPATADARHADRRGAASRSALAVRDVARRSAALWPLYALAALGGAVDAFDLPARQALVPTLVPREHLPNAISLNTIMMQSGRGGRPGARRHPDRRRRA